MASRARTVYVTDLDGTLLGNDALLSQRSRRGLSELLEAGLLLTVASARSVVAMQRILSGLRLPLPVVEFNGAFISDLASGGHLVANAMDSESVSLVYHLISDYGVPPFVSTFDGKADRLYYSQILNPGMQWYVDDRTSNLDRRLVQTDDLQSRLGEQVVCLTVIDRPAAIAELGDLLSAAFSPGVDVRRFGNEYFPDWHWLTVHDRRATKDQAVSSLLEFCGLGQAEVVAFGDSDNDVPLFRLASRSIAVANASAELKSLATEVIGPCSEDSVVAFLEREWAAGPPS
jgi:Cof subfamily protein (haloacid dehalogenase superfamily)